MDSSYVKAVVETMNQDEMSFGRPYIDVGHPSSPTPASQPAYSRSV